jgi:hypothetical protein
LLTILDKADSPQMHREHRKVNNAVEQEEAEETEERQMTNLNKELVDHRAIL